MSLQQATRMADSKMTETERAVYVSCCQDIVVPAMPTRFVTAAQSAGTGSCFLQPAALIS